MPENVSFFILQTVLALKAPADATLTCDNADGMSK